MYDFLLNNHGDILFYKTDKQENSFQLDFFIAPSDSLSFDFYIDNYNDFEYISPSNSTAIIEPGMIFSFNTQEVKNDKDICITENEEDLIFQKIKIRLSSAINTIEGNKDIGSNLELYKHRLITKDDTFTDIYTCIQEAISDILPNAKIDIKLIESIYIDYSCSIKVTIQYKDYNFYYYL